MAEKTTVRELLARLGFEIDSGPLKKWDAGISRAKQGMGDLVKVVAVGAGVIAGITGTLFAVAASAAAVGDNARKAAQAVSVTTEEYQELGYAASIAADATEQELNVALKTQARNAEAASRGTGEAVKAYQTLGVSVTSAGGKLKTQVELLKETADAFRSGAAAGKETALAQRIFGESGAKLIPMLRLGAEGIDQLQARARELGMVISDDAAAASEKFNDTLTDLRAGVSGLKNALGTALLPVLTPVIEAMRDWLILNREALAGNLRAWADGMATAIKAITPAVRAADVIVRKVFGGWGPVIAVTTALVISLTIALFGLGIAAAVAQVVWGLVAALSALAGIIGIGLLPLIALVTAGIITWGIVLAVPLAVLAVALGAVVAVVGALYLAIEDVYTFLTGGDSLLGRFIERWRDTDGVMGQVIRTLDAVGGYLTEVWGNFRLLGQIASEVGSIVLGVAGDMASALGSIIADQLEPLTSALGEVKDLATGAWLGLVEGLWSGFADVLERVAKHAGKVGDALRGVLGFVRGLGADIDSEREQRGGNLFRGGGGQQLPPQIPASAGTGPTITDNRSVSVQAPISISGAGDPAAVADAVNERLGQELRQARDVFSAGDR